MTTQAFTLFEGDNWFWLTYDINEMAEEGQKVDAALVSATLSDGIHTVANGNPAGDRTVKNIVEFVKGNNTRKVNNKLTFKTKNANFYRRTYHDFLACPYWKKDSDRLLTFRHYVFKQQILRCSG